jgi:hypothetical protein
MGAEPQTSVQRDGAHRVIESGEVFFSLLKELAIVVLVLLFIVSPGVLKKRLKAAGVTQLDLGVVKADIADDDSKKAASVVSNVQQQADEIKSTLADIAKRYPAAASDVSALRDRVGDLQSQANSADKSLKASLLSQQEIVQQVSPQAVASSGWLYMGEVDETKTKWTGVGAKCVDPSRSTNFAKGDKFTVTTSVFLHGNPPAGQWHTAGDVAAAAPAQTQFEVLDSDYSGAKTGGFFLWLKVSRVP